MNQSRLNVADSDERRKGVNEVGSKRTYETPVLTVHGTLQEITELFGAGSVDALTGGSGKVVF